MLPKEFTETENVFQDEDDRLERRTTRRGRCVISMYSLTQAPFR